MRVLSDLPPSCFDRSLRFRYLHREEKCFSSELAEALVRVVETLGGAWLRHCPCPGREFELWVCLVCDLPVDEEGRQEAERYPRLSCQAGEKVHHVERAASKCK